MFRCSQVWITLSAACLVALCLGCRPGANDGSPERSQTAPAQQAGDNGEPADAPTDVQPTDVQPAEPKPPPPKPTIPEVKLSEQDAAMCMVHVGDLLPEGTLADTEGEQHELRSLRGEKLTVVCFWKAELTQALEELRQLGVHVVEPYAEKGVRVVGINVADSPDVAREKLRLAETKFTNLLDPDGEYFHKVATEKLPRTYLLDAEGKILWFDVEYSRSTRRDLLQAIQAALSEQ